MYQNNRSRLAQLLTRLSGFSIFLAIFFSIGGGVASAVTINNANIPSIHQNHSSTYGRQCTPGPSQPVHKHSQQGWISRANQPANISPISVSSGTSSLSLQWNVLSSNCTSNFSPANLSGNIANKAIQTTRYHHISASSNIGSVSGFNSYLDTNYSNTYGSPELFYVKESSALNAMPVHDGFTLSGIGGLAPGTYTVTVNIQTRAINRYSSGYHACVAGGDAANLSDTNCGTVTAGFSFLLVVQPPPEPNITVFTYVDCNTIRVTADTTTNANWDVLVIRNGVDTAVLVQNIPDNTSIDIDISSLQASGGGTYQVRVRDTSNNQPRTSGNLNIPACPTINSFTVTCSGGISLRATTDTGSVWAARLFVDGVSISSNSAGRVPSSGFIASGQSVDPPKSVQPWHDIRSHTFQVRVDDQSNPTKLQRFSEVVTLPPCLVPACSQSTLLFNPNPTQPGLPFEMTLNLGFARTDVPGSGTIGSLVSFSYNAAYDSPTFNPSNYATAGGTSRNVATGASASSGSPYRARFSNITADAGNHSGTVTASPAGAGAITCTFGQTGAPPCFAKDPATGNCDFSGQSIEANPAIQAFRGDVIAGAPIFESGGCSTSGAGEVQTYNQGSSGSYKGSGGQLGVMSRGSIIEFVSASLRTASPTKPNGLSFSNTPTPGNFAHLSLSCTNYFSDYDDAVASTTNAGFIANALPTTFGAERILSHRGNLIIPGYSPFPGKITVYVNGDLSVIGNIQYTNGYASVASIPNVRFIVRGNIYISPNVTRLDGTYIAMPVDAANGGAVFTCSPIGTSPEYDELKDNCAKATPLRFYGSVLAKYIHLHRLAGTSNDANIGADYNDPTLTGETFVESPLHWIVRPQTSGTAGQSTKYESVTKLPPVL